MVVNAAIDAARFARIRPHFDGNEATKVAVGDAGWLRGAPDHMQLTVVKGRAVLDLELFAPNAEQNSSALVALGRAAIARL